MTQRLLFIALNVLVGVLALVILVRSDCLQLRDECLGQLACGFAMQETSKPDVCGDASSRCLLPESQKTMCQQMLEMLRRDYHLDQCTCDPDNLECRQFKDMITKHPCDVSRPRDDDYHYTEEPDNPPGVSKSVNPPYSEKSISSGWYDSDLSSGSSWKSSEDSLVDCWTENNRCRWRDNSCGKALSTFEMACSCDVTEPFPCASDSPKCQEARKSLDAFSLVNCGCPEQMSHRKRCQFVYDKLFNNPCIDGCKSYVVQSDTALNGMKQAIMAEIRRNCENAGVNLIDNTEASTSTVSTSAAASVNDSSKKDVSVNDTSEKDVSEATKILPYQDAINKCTEAEGDCINYLEKLSTACYSNCSQAKCQRATGDFVGHVDPMISHSVLFSDCKGSNGGPECVNTTCTSKIKRIRKCAVTVSPMPNCLELPNRCQGILGCQLQFQNFQNHCDPNRCGQDVYSSCRTAYAALFATPIVINCTCDPDDVDFQQCRVFQRRVSENSCVDRSILFFQDPTFEEQKDHGTCTMRLAGESNPLRIKTDTVIRVPSSDSESSLCQCKANGQLGYCHDLPNMQNMSCDDNKTTGLDKDKPPRNGICICFTDEVVCSKPRNGIDAHQLDNGQTYLFIGYSTKEFQYIKEYTGEHISDAVFQKQLQELLDDESQVTSKCELVLVPLETHGNLLFKSFEEGGGIRKKTSVTCIGALMYLASVINGRRMPLITSPVLSVLKVASVDHHSNHPQRLTLSSGTDQHLPQCFSWFIVLLEILVVLDGL